MKMREAFEELKKLALPGQEVSVETRLSTWKEDPYFGYISRGLRETGVVKTGKSWEEVVQQHKDYLREEATVDPQPPNN